MCDPTKTIFVLSILAKPLSWQYFIETSGEQPLSILQKLMTLPSQRPPQTRRVYMKKNPNKIATWVFREINEFSNDYKGCSGTEVTSSGLTHSSNIRSHLDRKKYCFCT